MARNHPPGGAPDGAQRAPKTGPLTSTLRRGAVISAGTLIVVQVISLAQTLALARLLSPAEIGIYAAGTVLTGFLVMFSESGMQGALIQREHDVEDAADTVFWVTAATGVLMSLAALAAAPIVAMVFRSDLVGEVAAVTSGMLLMYSLTNVPDGLMQRRFNFKRRLIIDPSRAFAYAAVAVALAASGFGVWSLVIGNYASLAVWLFGTWILARWRPGRGRPSVRLWREMARFAFPLLVQGVVAQVRNVAESVLIGRRLGEASLGQYRYGRRLAILPGEAVVEVGSYVLFPAFSRLATDPERLKWAFLRALRWIWFAAAPVAALVIAVGEPAVVVLLGEQWRGAGVFLVAMSGYGAGIALQAVASEVIKGSGRSRLFNWISAVQLILGVGLIVVLLPLGLLGVGLAISAAEIAVAVLVLGLARSVVPFSMGELFRRLVPPVVSSLVALALIGPLEHVVTQSDQRGVAAGLGLLGLETIGFGLVYLVVMRVVDPPMIAELIGSVRSRLSDAAADEPALSPEPADAAPGSREHEESEHGRPSDP